jgi:hypothetical protein
MTYSINEKTRIAKKAFRSFTVQGACRARIKLAQSPWSSGSGWRSAGPQYRLSLRHGRTIYLHRVRRRRTLTKNKLRRDVRRTSVPRMLEV